MPITSKRPPVEPDEKLQIGQAAKKLGISRETMRRYIKSGFIKIGMFSVPSTIEGREARSYVYITGQSLLDFWDKRKLK